jgi:hypothetical protein
MAGTVAPNIVTDGLVLYLDAANTKSYVSGSTTWVDIAAGNNGTLVNGPTYNNANGGSIVFDGADDVVNCGDNPSINLLNDVSVNIWFKINSLTGFQGIIAKRNTTTGYTNYGINFSNESNAFQLYFNTIGGSNFRILQVTISNNFAVNIWYNVCGVFEKSGSNTVSYLYKNGMLLSSNSLVGNLATVSTPLTIGSTSVTAQEPFNGNIASTQIYNRALSATEVLQNYNATKTRFGL